MFRNRHHAQLRDARGFTLIDTLATLAVFATVSAIALPRLTSSLEGQRLGMETRNVERELQSARLSAVATNRPIRIRFNCPSAGRYRRVEVIGTVNVPHADDAEARAVARCGYPFPAADTNPLTRPNNDGQTLQLNSTVTFTAVQTLEFWPDGTVHVPAATNPWPRLGATDATITVAKGSSTKSIKVNSLGKIRIQ
jgi:type II secretory pathway pseudopilin PulG